jgi:hypothetical protein
MEKKKIDVRAGMLFPVHFHVLAGVFLLAALFIVGSHPLFSAGLAFFGALILTAFEGTQIDPSSRTLREYYSFFFLKTGKEKKYASIEGIAIYRAKVSQKVFTSRTMNSSTFTHTEYNAYLKLYGDEKVFLVSDKNKVKLMEKARKIAGDLNTIVTDHAIAK